jgi:hypothetical protein
MSGAIELFKFVGRRAGLSPWFIAGVALIPTTVIQVGHIRLG